MPFASASDGCQLHYEVLGNEDAPALLVGYPWTDGLLTTLQALDPAAPVEEMRTGNQEFLAALAARFRVVHMDYPRGTPPTEGPLPGDLTPARATADYLTIADAAGVDRFGVVGYSWSGGAALQIACRTERAAAIAVGGWPALSAPYAELLEIVRSNVAAAGGPTTPLGAFLSMIETWYASIVSDFDEATEIPKLDGPRVLYVGENDVGAPEMLGAEVGIAGPILARRAELEALGWKVCIEAGHDHLSLPASRQAEIILEAFDGQRW